MLRSLAALALLAALACAPSPARLERGAIAVELDAAAGLQVWRDGVEVLRSRAGSAVVDGGGRQRAGAAYAPFAVARTVSREVEEVFGFFDFYDRVEAFEQLRVVEPVVDDARIRFTLQPAGDGELWIDGDGAVVLRWSVPRRHGDRLAMSFACRDDERFFGMGAQVSVEHRGQRVPIWAQEQGIGKADRGEPPAIFGVQGAHYDSYAPVPFALSSRPLGLWLAGDHRAEFDFCERGEALRLQTEGPAFELHLYPVTSMVAAVEHFTADTGRPRPLARWNFAPWFDLHGGPEALRTGAHTLRREGIPASAIWAEDWVGTLSALGGEHLSYDWEQDPARYPDLAGLAAELHGLGLRYLTYINPFVPDSAAVRPALAAADALVRDDSGAVMTVTFPFGDPPALVDPTAPGAAAVFAEYLGRAVDAGVDGWMADYGEALPFDAVLSDGRDGAAAHNAYPRLWAAMSHDFWRQRRDDGDYAVFSRSGHTGMAGVSPIHWLGDQLTSFDRNDGLGSVVPLYLSAGLSGIALTHSDVGGYTSVGSSVRSRELWQRWLVLEAFTPIFRTHHSSDPAGNLQWHSDAETLALARRYARWHQRLVPYFAQVAAQASERGWPAVRPLWWGAEAQPELLAVDDAVRVGDELVLAPIVVEGATRREVLLPPGRWRAWRELWGELGPPIEGPVTVTAEAAPDQPLLWVRAGAALPLLAADHDSLAPPRADRPLAAGVDVAPAHPDELLLLLLAGGRAAGGLECDDLPGASWRWRGEALASGPLQGLRVDGVALPTCGSPRARDCVAGGQARLTRRWLDGRTLTIESAAGQGELEVESATLETLYLELR